MGRGEPRRPAIGLGAARNMHVEIALSAVTDPKAASGAPKPLAVAPSGCGGHFFIYERNHFPEPTKPA
jgi:hypothetical protein